MRSDIKGKPLDKAAFETAKKLKETKKSYDDIADILRSQGYRVMLGASGGAQVSKHCLDYGFRIKSYDKPKSTYKNKKQNNENEDFMLDVLSSYKLSKNQKIKVLTALLDE